MSSVEENDPRKIRQNQQGEGTPMTLEQLRRKAEEIDAKNQPAVDGQNSNRSNADRRLRLGNLGEPGWSSAGGVGFNNGLELARSASKHQANAFARFSWEAAFSTGPEFYRREMERRKNYYQRPWLWFLGPVLAAIVFYMCRS